jgi:hypothetical protein
MGCTQSDPIPVPFRKLASVLKLQTIQGREPLNIALLSIVGIPEPLPKIFPPAVWKRSAFGKAGVKSAQVCPAYKVYIFTKFSQILLLTVWPIPVKHGLATGISNNEKVHHSRFLGHRRVLACPASYGRCSNVSYKGFKSPEPR